MNSPLILLVAALAQPTEVLEEWEIAPESPSVEAITARAVYHPDGAARARLPEVVQGEVRPDAFVPGVAQELAVVRGPAGWEVEIPPSQRATARIVARLARPTPPTRLFRLVWPQITPNHVATRRVAQIPRRWLQSTPAGWTCTDDGADLLACVTTERSPQPFYLRAQPPASPRRWWIVCGVLVLAAMSLAGWTAGAKQRREAMVGAGVGLLVGAAVSVALAGSVRFGWAQALAMACVAGALLGSAAMRSRLGTWAGSLTLAVLPLIATIDGSLAHVVALSALTAVAILAGRFIPRRSPPSPPPAPETADGAAHAEG